MDYNTPKKSDVLKTTSSARHGRNELVESNETLVTPEVVQRMCDGDEDAYRTIYYRYSRPLLAFLTKLTGSQDESEDILQAVFIWIWENRAKIDSGRNIKSYIFTISKNAALKYLRDNRRHEELSEAFDNIAGEYTVADEAIMTKETMLLVEITINNMPRNRKEVFKLYPEGLSYEEISRKLNITQDNARKYVMRARNDIREVLAVIAFFVTLNTGPLYL